MHLQDEWSPFTFCVQAKQERILIMSILSLYIYRNIQKKFDAIVFQGHLEKKPLFHVIASQFKGAEAWVLSGYKRATFRERPQLAMPSHFRVFWKEASLSCYGRAKGRYHKKNCSNFENSKQLGSSFYSATLFSQFLTKQKCLERTCLIFDYYQNYYYIQLRQTWKMNRVT